MFRASIIRLQLRLWLIQTELERDRDREQDKLILYGSFRTTTSAIPAPILWH